MSYYCELCDKWLKTFEGLQKHKEMSPRHRRYCDTCDREFGSESSLTQHYRNSSRHDYCGLCDEHFDDRDDLEEHYEDEHWYCRSCNEVYDSDEELQEHYSDAHHYCESCRRFFSNENSLNMHLRTSTIHNKRKYTCPGRACGKSFVAYGDLALHLESGACRSGVTRQKVNNLVVRVDKHNVITNPARLLAYEEDPVVEFTWANDEAWNGDAYECFLCHRTFRLLSALNAHLESPAHAEKIYRCPVQYDGCGGEYRTLSGLLSHIERSECEVRRFRKQVTGVLDSVTQRMKRLAI